MKKISNNLLALLALGMVAVPAMAQDTAEDSLVNVAFRKVAAQDIMGGVSTVNYRELTEKNYNTYSLDNMQGYVSGFNGNGMWGLSDHLVLIDGVPRDANNVTPSEIESVTFMKGAQAVVLYGSKAANGVVLITTKRGRVNNGLTVSVRANTGWNVAKAFPEYLGAAEYMRLYNEACANDGIAAAYSNDLINKTASGVNPYRYPDVEFYSSEFVKKAYNRTDVTAEIEGGNDRAKFYANVSYYTNGDFLKFGEAKNNRTDRFNVRGNVDMRLSSFLTAYVNANATYYNSKSANGANFWETAATWRPNTMAPFIPMSYIDPNSIQANDKIAGASNFYNGMFINGSVANKTNIFADYMFAGNNTWTSRQFQFDSGINFDLNGVLRGLSFAAAVAVDYRTSYTTSYNNSYMIFEPSWGTYGGKEVIYALENHETNDGHSGVQNMSNSSDNQTISFNAHFDYNRTFGGVHNVSAILVANGYQQSESGVYHKVSNANLGLGIDYNYDRKYYVSASVATPWSAKLPEGKRAGFSPSGTLGWNLSKENFMKGSIFNDLVLSVSASNIKTDLGIDNYYMYLGAYQEGNWWNLNGISNGHAADQAKRGANDDLGYIQRKEFSVNLRGSLFDRALTFDASFFTNQIAGKIIEATNLNPSYFSGYESSFRSYINFENDSRTGFDLAVNYKKQLTSNFGISAGANLTYFSTKASKRDDISYGTDANRYRQGHAIDEIFGYKCIGFFKDQADIDNSPKQDLGSVVKPGDMKYQDINGDGVVDYKDETALGHWNGNTTLGINVTFKYKTWSLFMLGVGSFGGKALKNNSYWWVKGADKYSAAVRDRAICDYEYTVINGENVAIPGTYHVTNLETAAYPRLTTGGGQNNFTTSDFWMYSTSRFDLAKIQLSYDFTKQILGNGIVKGLQVYGSVNNLLTVAKESEIMKLSVGSAPQARFYNIGAKVTF